MTTKRQKKTLKAFAFALSVCVGLSAFLIFTNISNTAVTQPVRISEILDGAMAYAGDDDGYRFPAVTLDAEQLSETMFSRELLTFTSAAPTGFTAASPLDTYEEYLSDEIADTYSLPEPVSVDSPIYLPDDLHVETAMPPSFGGGNPAALGGFYAEELEETETAAAVTTTAASTTLTSSSKAGTTAAPASTADTAAAAPGTSVSFRTTVQTQATQIPPSYTTFRSFASVSDTPAVTALSAPSTPAPAAAYSSDDTTAPLPVPETTARTAAAPAAETTSATSARTTAATTVRTTASYTTAKSITTAPASSSAPKTSPVTIQTAVPRETAAHTEKTPFTNVGGGEFSDDNNVYMTLFELVNEARREAGLNELWYSARVHEVCEIRTTELSSYYSHTRPDGSRFSTAFKEVGIAYTRCGENIAYGRNMFSTPEEVFAAWMDSPSHRDNILCKDYECVAFGLCVLKVGPDTYYYWSQEFATF